MFTLDKQYILDIGGLDNNNPPYKENKNCEFKTIEEIKKELDNLEFKRNIIIQGGEPSIHKDFLKIVRMVLDKKPKRVIVITNARLFSQKEIAEKLMFEKKVEFFVKVWNCNDKLHDKLTKVEGSFDQTTKGIDNLIELGFKVKVLVPIIKDNCDNLKEILEEISKKDISDLIFLKPDATYLDEGKKISDEKVLELVKKLKIPRNEKFLVSFENIFEKEVNKLEIVKNKVLEKSLINISLDEIQVLLRTIEEKGKFWDFVYDTGYPTPLVILMLDELEKQGFISVKGDKVKLEVKLKKLGKISDFSSQRLESDPDVCQLTVAHKDVEKRIKKILEACGSGGKIAMLGDDDFVSLSIAGTNLFDEVIVFEIDQKIVNRINEIAEKNNLKVTAIQHDLRKKFPNKYKEKFDVFYTDSPYSLNGFNLFVSRGVSLLKKELKKHGFASFTCEMAIVEGVELPAQRVINDMGLFVETKYWPGINDIPKSLREKYTDIHELKKMLFDEPVKFSKLEDWYFGALGRKEFLFHFLTSDTTKPLITEDYFEDIYYDEEQTPLQFYTDLEYIDKMKKKFPGSYEF